MSFFRNNRFGGFPSLKWMNALLWLLPLGFLSLFYFFPLATIIQTSISRSSSSVSQLFVDVFSDPAIRKTILFTGYQAGLSTLLTLLVGLPGAYVFARFEFPGKSFLRLITGLPFVMPTLVVATAFTSLLGPRSPINLVLMSIFKLEVPVVQLSHTFGAILLAHIFYNTTIVIRIVGDFWGRLSIKLRNAAQVLGANWFESTVRIILPLISPAILAAGLLVFIFDFTSFGVILVLGGARFSTLEVEIYYQTISLFNLPVAAVLSLIQIVFTLVLTVLYARLSNTLSMPLEDDNSGSGLVAAKSTKVKLMVYLVVTFLAGLTLFPLGSLVYQSFFSSIYKAGVPVNTHFTLEFFRQLSVNSNKSIADVSPMVSVAISLLYAFLTVLISIGIGLPTAYLLSRKSSKIIRHLLDPLILLPLGTSAVTLGLGFIITFDHPPLDLRASPVIIPIAHALVAFPFVVRILTPAFNRIQPQLIFASSVLGANPFDSFRYIELPLIGKTIIVAATFAFMISMGEFGATALLYRPEYPTIPVMIYRLLSRPGALNYGKAMALSTLLMFIVVAGMAVIEKFKIKGQGEF